MKQNDVFGEQKIRLLKNLWGVIRKVLTLFAFAIFPVLIIQTAIRQVESLEVEKRILDARLRHERVLSKLKEADDDALMVSRSIVRVFQKTRNEKNEIVRNAHLKKLAKIYPGVFDIYFFDPSGILIPKISARKCHKRAIEQTFQTLQDLSQAKKVEPGQTGLLLTVLNIPLALRGLEQQERHIRLGRREQNSYYLWSAKSSSPDNAYGGFIAFLHSGKFRKDRALQDSVKWLNRRFKKSKFGYIDVSSNSLNLYPATWNAQEGLKTAFISALGRYDKQIRSESYHGDFILRKNAGFLFALSPHIGFFPKRLLNFIHLLCVVWILLVFLRMPNQGEGIGGRIPTKLVALFLFAIGTPSLVLLVGGFYALKDHENVLLQNLETRIKEKLHDFDERFPTEISRLETWVGQQINKARKVENIAGNTDLFESLRAEKVLEYFYVVDRSGKAIYSFNKGKENESIITRTNKFAAALGRELLRRLTNSLKLDAGSFMVETTEGVLTTLIGDGNHLNIDLISRDLGKLTLFSMGQESSYAVFDALYDRKGEAEFAILGFMNRGRVERNYINRQIKDLVRQPDLQWEVNAVGDPEFCGRILTSPDDKWSQIRKMAQEVVLNKSSVRLIAASGTVDELWFGQHLPNIQNFVFVAKSSLEPLKERVRQLWILLVGLALMVFASSFVIGTLLSEQILKPIDSLTQGVRSIENRNFDFEIPIHSNDELGELSFLMNNVIEGMKDLQIARIVQESLFPPDILEIKDYVIWGKSRAMADIGGDYFDYFPAGENRLTGLIGDVSGHGISAALIMGMAKCAFTMEESSSKTLVELMSGFNRFMLKTIKRKKMMTLFLYSLDLETNILHFCNAGHNFPMHWRAKSQTMEFIAQESFPLGVREKSRYSARETSIEPGDAILFYTDGLVEAFTLGDVQLGYNTAEEWFKSCAHLSPTTVVERLFTKLDGFTKGLPAADDVSMICLKRKA